MNNTSPTKKTGNIGTVMTVLAWVVFMALLGFYFKDVLDKQRNPNQVLSTRYTDDQTREVTLLRNKYGHYVTSGQINGRAVIFILDTGATGIAIPEPVARALGLRRGRAFPVHTANGTTTSYTTRLGSVSVGEIELNNVEAGIVPGLEGDEILLGMSFLQHIEFTQRGNTLVLKQYL